MTAPALACATPAGAALPSVTAPTAVPAAGASADLRTQFDSALTRSSLTADQQARIRAHLATAPTGLRSLSAAAAGDALAGNWTELRTAAIDPGHYNCSDTALVAWLDATLEGVDGEVLFLFSLLSAFDLPSYDALAYGSESKTNTFGIDGAATNALTHTMRDLTRFWDIPSADIQLLPMHGGDVFTDVDRVIRAYEAMGVDRDEAEWAAPIVLEIFDYEPLLKAGAHPIFTFNAFAFTAKGDPEAEALGVGDRIVMGDGILSGMSALGLGKTAPRSILAHEFGHHVQYEDNLFDSPLTGPAATRRTELMADSFASYFLTHKKGESLNKHAVVQDALTFFNVGDCSFASNGHHGTPNQRARAATWGAETALAAKPASAVLPSLNLAALFESKLPTFVAPDAP